MIDLDTETIESTLYDNHDIDPDCLKTFAVHHMYTTVVDAVEYRHYAVTLIHTAPEPTTILETYVAVVSEHVHEPKTLSATCERFHMSHHRD